MVKEFGSGVLWRRWSDAGSGINNDGRDWRSDVGAGLIVGLVPVVIASCFEQRRCRCEWAAHLLFGVMGARTCAPAMEIISDTARSNIPALGYAGARDRQRPADAGRDNHRHGMARIRIKLKLP